MYVHFFEYENLKRSFDKKQYFRKKAKHRVSSTFSKLAVKGAFYRCAIAENRIRQHTF